ncbi:MAG: FAD-binding oxidoreductase [Burkholderiales bacterium]|nr:FAD-binding oxidoreductase [Burkholderiales bacterium]
MDHEALLSALRDAAGPAQVLSDPASRAYYANDIFWQPGVEPLAVVLPRTRDQAAAAVRAAAAHGAAIVPRGGGMSYTKGYLPQSGGAVVIDTRGLDRVLEVNVADRYITVEAGCTWAQVHEALQGSGMNTGYWGPLSGINATVGGALSQNSAFFGSTLHGTVAEHVLGVTVALAQGEVVTTGSGGRVGTKPFTRYAGPDLTGLFLGDTGAFGLKLAATLKLQPAPQHLDYLGFGFETMGAMARAQVEMSAVRAISEGFGIDRAKALNSASVNKLADGVKILGSIARSSKGLVQGIKDAVGVAATGPGYLADHACSLHLVVEGRSAGELADRMAALRAIGRKHGVEIENAAARVMRARPFNPVRGMLGADGQRWVPIHAVFPLSEAARVVEASAAYFKSQEALMRQHGIILSHLTMTVGNEFFLEPAFYWPDEITPLHRRSLGDEVVGPWLGRPANLPARDAVIALRQGAQQVYLGLGGVNWQVGRDYPLQQVMQPASWDLLNAVKRALDPQGRMNPGSLGLDAAD